MGKIALKIGLSIVIGMALLRFGYEFKNDWLSIITQSLGYVVISYPFFIFFKIVIWKIKEDIKQHKINKQFYSQKGTVYGMITVDKKPLSGVKFIVKNQDGSNHKWTHKWVGYSHQNGYFNVKFLPDGMYMCEYAKVFATGSSMLENFTFEVKDGNQVLHNIEIKK
jgi:hypothetical protein